MQSLQRMAGGARRARAVAFPSGVAPASYYAPMTLPVHVPMKLVDADAVADPRTVKFKSRFKRANKVLVHAGSETMAKRQKYLDTIREPIAEFTVGDAVEIEYLAEASAEAPTKIRGTVIERRRRGLNTSFTLLNHVEDTYFVASYLTSSPLLRSLRVVRKGHALGKKNKLIRNKLKYLIGRPESAYKVTDKTREQWEEELEKRIVRELQRRGRDFSNKAVAAEKEKLFRTGKGVIVLDKTLDVGEGGMAEVMGQVRRLRKSRRQQAARQSAAASKKAAADK